jgi:hypothetical protein
VVSRINAIQSREMLKALRKAAIRASSMEEFEQKLKGQANCIQ